ncbi:MAG: Gfo/Idh/MocA family oxidoreductase [Bryobacteraceae bacterium]
MDRRHFLLSSAAAAHAASAQRGPNDRIGTAMIGTGNRGSHVLRGVLEQPIAKVVALCDIKPDRLDSAATIAAKDNPATYNDWRKIIDRKDIDAVFIATPPHLHAEMAIAALKAGKHVYSEKPIAITPASIRELLKAAKASNKVFVAGQQMRSFRQLGQAVEKIRNGAIGEVLMVKAQRHASADLNHEGSSADWYFNFSKSGGYLIEQSVHNLDACNWVIGEHPIRASGFGGTVLYKNDPPGRDILDSCTLSFEYPRGVNLSFTQMVFHPRGLPAGNQYIYVYGSKGAVDLLGGTMFYPRNGQGQPAPLAPKQEEPQHAHVTAFYDCIQQGKPSPADAVVGATAALTSILAHEASVNRKIVEWKDFHIDF